MSQSKFYLFIQLIIISFSGVCQAPDDSLKVANAFIGALQDPQNKDKYIQEATDIYEKNKTQKFKDTYYYWFVRYSILSGQLKQADSLAKIPIKKTDTFSIDNAKFYNLLGSSKMMQQDFVTATEYLQLCIEIYERNEQFSNAAYVKNNLANLFFTLADFESAYKYAHEAFEVLDPVQDSLYYISVQGILSISEAKIEKYKQAKVHATNTLEQAKIKNDLRNQAIAYYALGTIYLGEENYNVSIENFQKCLETAKESQYKTMEHLAEVELLHAYVQTRSYSLAKIHGEMALNSLAFQTNLSTEYAIKKNLSIAYAGLKLYEQAYKFGHESDSIFREKQLRENKEYIDELLIKYEAEKKDQALKLEQQENLTNQAQIRKQGWFLVTLGLVLVSLLLIFFSYRNKQKSKLEAIRLEQEKSMLEALIKGEEKERERIAGELHDGLASNLTGIKIQLEQMESSSKEVFEAIQNAHKETRRISHNLSPIHIETSGLAGALKSFCAENSTEVTKINFFAQPDKINYKSQSEQTIIYRMCQEVVQNALKHSKATSIDVQIIQQKERLVISIEDDGIGFDLSKVMDSFGMKNLMKNAELLGGNINIDSHQTQGTAVFITIPTI